MNTRFPIAVLPLKQQRPIGKNAKVAVIILRSIRTGGYFCGCRFPSLS